ncbi:MAG: hypothetical protein ACI9ZH_002364 [Paracoccaceae bacterium]
MDALKTWSGPDHVIFRSNDLIFTPESGETWSQMPLGAAFDVIDRAEHVRHQDLSDQIDDMLDQNFKHI